MFASFLTALYCLVQMLVLVGLIVSMAANTLCYPTTVFFLFVSGTFVLGAVIHPQEFWCVIHGFSYYLAIPSMYMLLMIYSMCNLHVVSWGTREVKQTPTEKQMEEQKKEMAELKRLEEEKKKNGVTGMMSSMFMPNRNSKDEEGWSIGCGDCFRFTCCPREVNTQERIMELKLILAELQKMQANVTENVDVKIGEVKKAIEELKQQQQPQEQEENLVVSQQAPRQSRVSRVFIDDNFLILPGSSKILYTIT